MWQGYYYRVVNTSEIKNGNTVLETVIYHIGDLLLINTRLKISSKVSSFKVWIVYTRKNYGTSLMAAP